MTDTTDAQAPEPDVDYWASEPVENQAVAEWWEQQPERRQAGGQR